MPPSRRNPPAVNIVEAIYDDRLFGSLFKAINTWTTWIVFLKAVFGVTMAQRELELYRQYTGRRTQPAGGVKESYAIVGRRGGKSRIVAVAAVYIACFKEFRDYLAAGENGVVLILARDRDQARVVFNYIKGILGSIPVLAKMVKAWRSDEIELRNRVTIAVKPSDYRAVRGVTVVACVADEVAFWDSQGVNPDTAVFQALRPAMATVPEAKLLVISSPYAKFGELFEAHRKYYGQDNPHVLVWQAPTAVMNPTITESFIRGEIERDPEAGRSEWLALFREDITAAFSLESIEQCVIRGRSELLPAPNIPYRAFADPSGGRHDWFSVAIAHRSGDVGIVDLLKAWKPPFDPSDVVKQCAEVLKPFRITAIVGDNYAGEWPKAEFAKHGITYEVADKHRSDLYLNLIPVVNSRRVELPDDRRMIEELRRLERRRGRTGKDQIDHPQYAGSDDLANSVAGVVYLTLAGQRLDTSQIFLVGQRLSKGGWDAPEEHMTIGQKFDAGLLSRKNNIPDW